MAVPVTSASRVRHDTVDGIELTLLLEAIYQHLGDEFRGYEQENILAKAHAFMRQNKIGTLSILQNEVLHTERVGDALVRALYAHPSAMFQNPGYQHALRQIVARDLHSWPDPNIWIPECKSAEEVFSLAILLEEAGLYAKSRIFVTCPNHNLLADVMNGSVEMQHMAEYEGNYRLSGGPSRLVAYGAPKDDRFVFSAGLRDNIVWSQSGLSTDASFNEFQFVLGRGATSDFGNALKRRSLHLFDQSLSSFGILSVDPANAPILRTIGGSYKTIDADLGLYKRLG